MTKILIIEDNESTRENIHDILELEGFKTLVATHGQQGLELAQTHIPDLIICDVMMPELNGYQVLEALGKHEHLAGIPFIFLTAKSTRHDFRQGMASGSNDYLTKPFSPSELVSSVRMQLNKRRAMTRNYIQQINKLKHTISELAQVDTLTQLPNQTALNLILEKHSAQKKPLSLFLISVDQFSFLSSTLTLADCDELIKLIAERIQKTFPYAKGTENLRDIFRLGHNQFSVLTDQTAYGDYSLTQIAERFINLLRAPYILNGQAIKITVSIGITSTKSSSETSNNSSRISNLLQDARVALYKVQEKGGNDYSHYSPEMTLNAFEKLDVANALHYALQQGEFQLYYQPQLDFSRGYPVGAEALLRWHSEQLGWVTPGKFIPIAEEIGLISEVSNWILFTACSQAEAWQQQFDTPISVSVNLSPIQLAQDGLCEAIRTVLQKTQLPPHLLCLEITEKVLLKHDEPTIQTLQAIQAMGVRIAIDDFGTGYSGLEYLSAFPCNTIKVDRMFVQNIHERYTNQRIVAAVIKMSHELNLNVIAEGAETKEELGYLKLQGCDMVQGYAYAKPMPANKATAFMAAVLKSELSVELP